MHKKPRRRDAISRALGSFVVLVALVSSVPARAVTTTSTAPAVWLAAGDGGVFALGSASFHGGLGGAPPKSMVVATAARRSGKGYWLATLAGEVFAFGDAPRYGDLHALRLNQPVVDMVATPAGSGYWLAAADGGVFTFGDARFLGGLGGRHINKPVGGIVPTPSGRGYWLVAADGGVFTFGDARFFGSLGAARLPAPIAAMAATKDGRGYWLLGRDGRVTAFGNAARLGNGTGSSALAVGIVRTSTGSGYWIAYSNGTVRNFGDAARVSLPPVRLNLPVVGFATPWAASSGFALAHLDALRAAARAPVRYWPGAREAALTFDDGPSSYTAGVLAVLRRYHAPATFFTVGYQAAARPDLLRAEIAAGASVEIHDWDHADLTRLSPAAINDELRRAVSAVQSAIGRRPTCFRPPYGSTNATVVAEGAKLGLTQILWNVDPSDYLRPGASVIASRVLATATGRGLVIGIHDGGGDRSQTVAALPAIIDGLRARGYTLVRLCS